MIAKNNWQETVPILADEDNKFLCRKSTLVGNQPNLNEDIILQIIVAWHEILRSRKMLNNIT